LDGHVSGGEMDASRAAIRAYLAQHLQVTVNGSPLVATLDRIASWRDASAFQYLEGDLSYEARRGVGRLSIHADFLTELYPSHKTLGRITTSGRQERFTFEPTATYERTVT